MNGFLFVRLNQVSGDVEDSYRANGLEIRELQSDLEEIKKELGTSSYSSFPSKLDTIELSIGRLRSDYDSLSNLQTEISEVDLKFEQRWINIRGDISELKSDISDLDYRVSKLD
jgi:chromosome segregation ATPase